MAASSATVDNALDVIQKHVPPDKITTMLVDLSAVKGNSSFTITIKMLIERWRARGNKRPITANLTKSDWVVNGLLVQHPHPHLGRDCYVKRDLRTGGWFIYTLSGVFLRDYANADALVAAQWRPHRGPRRYFSELDKRVVRQPIDA
jgi:hypothetical protein